MIETQSSNEKVNIQTRIVKQKRLLNTEVLQQKYDYKEVGSNGFIEIDPPVVKFRGYELNKVNVQKVKLVNSSVYSQRIHIISPVSDVFQIKYDKKGLLAPGMGEEIYIFFKPTEYKYYFENIKIHCENGKIQIPIHGFPVMNNNPKIFENIIDFGAVTVGETAMVTYPIQNKIPLNFEYEFVELPNKNYIGNEVSIYPMSGKIPGKSAVDITISFTPKTNSTSIYEFQLDISQFDFQSLIVRIQGNGKNTNMSANTKQSIQVINNNTTSQNNQNKILLKSLTDKNEELSQSKREEKNTKQFTIKDKKQSKFDMKRQLTMNDLKKNKVDDPVIVLQRKFIERFNEVQQLDKEKEIRFFSCIGDYQISQQNIDQILGERQQLEQQKSIEKEKSGVHRYKIENDYDFPMIDQNVPEYECKWSEYKNDMMKKRRLNNQLFTMKVTSIVLKNRLLKRLEKVKKFLEGCSDRKEVMKKVQQDWLQAEYQGLGKKDYVQFKFDFEDTNVNYTLFPIQYDQTNQFNYIKYDIDARSGFDDWSKLENLKYSDAEVMRYKQLDMPQIIVHNSIESERKLRTGAEEEEYLMKETGILDSELNADIQTTVGPSFELPSEIQSHRILLEDYFLKNYEQFIEITEISPEFGLMKQKQLVYNDSLNIQDDNCKSKYEFMTNTPGLASIKAINHSNIEQSYYYQKRMNITNDFAYEKKIDQYCPELLSGPQNDDVYSEDDSDEEQELVINQEDTTAFLAKFSAEKDEDKKNTGIYSHQIEVGNKIANNVTVEKTKMISVIPTQSCDYNQFINNPENRIFII